MKHFLLLLLTISLSLSGCSPTVAQDTASLPAPESTPVVREASASFGAALQVRNPFVSYETRPTRMIPTLLPTQTATAAPFLAAPSPATPIPAEPPAPTPLPVYRTLRGEVTIAQAVCHYGPGAPYLYKYGVYLGSHLQILRRVVPGNYVELQAIGGNNPCWVKIDYLKLEDGTLEDLEPVSAADVPLPWSPYYPPLTGVSARRSGNEVTVSWHALGLRAGDDSEQVPYIVEAWVCQQGQITFVPAGSYQTSVKIIDEAGCAEPSRAWVTAAEKHGYTRRVAVLWPDGSTVPYQ
jgi:hypothetical protein